MSLRRFAYWFIAAAAVLVGDLSAHEMRPGLLELEEKEDDHWAMTWKVPARGPDMRLSIDVRLPDGFEWVKMPSREYVGEAFVDRGLFHMPGGLNNREIYIEGLFSTFTEAMVQIRRLDGTMQTARLAPSDPSLIVDARPSPSEIPKFYFTEGSRYLKGAWDHFAFVLILVFVCCSTRSTLISVGCFLAGMAATVLMPIEGLLDSLTRWVEVMVSLSLLPPALALVRPDPPTFVHQFPAAFAAIAGIFHGASLLSFYANSAPPEQSGGALFAFFFAALLGLTLFGVVTILLKTLLLRKNNLSENPLRFATPTAYAVGIIAITWTLQRW